MFCEFVLKTLWYLLPCKSQNKFLASFHPEDFGIFDMCLEKINKNSMVFENWEYKVSMNTNQKVRVNVSKKWMYNRE